MSRSSGRDAEFEDFVRDASPPLLRTAWFICGDPHQAEDLVQQALVEQVTDQLPERGVHDPVPEDTRGEPRSLTVHTSE